MNGGPYIYVLLARRIVIRAGDLLYLLFLVCYKLLVITLRSRSIYHNFEKSRLTPLFLMATPRVIRVFGCYRNLRQLLRNYYLPYLKLKTCNHRNG